MRPGDPKIAGALCNRGIVTSHTGLVSRWSRAQWTVEAAINVTCADNKCHK
jgi:hypothetical protein